MGAQTETKTLRAVKTAIFSLKAISAAARRDTNTFRGFFPKRMLEQSSLSRELQERNISVLGFEAKCKDLLHLLLIIYRAV